MKTLLQWQNDLNIDLSYKVVEGHNERERIFEWSHQFASGKNSYNQNFASGLKSRLPALSQVEIVFIAM